MSFENVWDQFFMIETNESGVTKTSEDTYAEYANSFDLSLLPMDESEIDLIPEHQHQHQQSALSASVTQSSHNLMNSGGNSTFTVSSTPPLSPEYIPTRVYESTNVPFAIKTEHWPSHNIVPKVIVDESPPSIASFATHSPSEEQFLTIFPPSPTPSIDFNNIKKEQPYFGNAFGLYPPSPPDSNGAPSPVGYHFADIKTEPFDIGCNETSVNLTSFLPNTFDLATNTLTPSSSPYDSSVLLQQQQQQLATTTTTSTAAITSTIPTLSLTPPLDSTRKDHQLLREYLQDTSFQKKHNLKPLALESLFVGDWSARGDIEPVISLALEHARKDVQQTCVTLNISADPEKWNRDQVRAWLQFTVKQFKLPSMPDIERVFTEDGVQLSQLNEIDFVNRLPQAGATLFAQLEIWKAACCDSQFCYFDGVSAADAMMASMSTMSNEMQTWPSSMDYDAIDEATFKNEDIDEMSSNSPPYECAPTDAIDSVQSNQTSGSELIATLSSNDASMVEATNTEQPKVPEQPEQQQQQQQQVRPTSVAPAKNGRHGSAHIHLWQFLKELLQTPQTNGTAIRWLDRTKGVFKIEDSVRVARLWGRRKNRPAMNYDKLSRSIRQYYKKGIMKKTERSQRLVYQFCHPYNM